MCQLFALNSSSSFNAAHLLQHFFQRGGGTDEHGDGWGVAYYRDNQSHCVVDQSAAHNSVQAAQLLDADIAATNLIAHIRKATQGDIHTQNCHPFRRELWSQHWSFAHNGTLDKTQLNGAGHFQPQGETDSEAAFCFLLNQLENQFGRQWPTLERFAAFLRKLCLDIAKLGSFNFILSNGSITAAFCTTQLHWAHVALNRHAVFASAESTSSSVLTTTLIATEPLPTEEQWTTFSACELKIFNGGQNIFTLA